MVSTRCFLNVIMFSSNVLFEEFVLEVLELRLFQTLCLLPVGDMLQRTCTGMPPLV